MKDFYLSKKLGRYFSKRLDFLIYAHDGRGLGHASRSIAIGMAVRRLFQKHKTLFVSGCKHSSALIGPSPLDWIKLPSYETLVVNSQSEGADGHSNFYKSVLGQLRADMLTSIVKIFKPRLVLVDHAPPGKREELLGALEETRNMDTIWVLGLRGIIGDDKDVWSEESARIFKQYYRSVLWYGDSNVLGHYYPTTIERFFGVKPIETGYVSRLNEIRRLAKPEKDPIAGTVAVPWGSNTTWAFIQKIHSVLTDMGDAYGPWHFFTAKEKKEAIQELFRDLSFCKVEEVSERYISSLLNSKVAILYAGYNSLTDILAAQVPSIILVRDIKDSEQDKHLTRLISLTKESIYIISESDMDPAKLKAALENLLCKPVWHNNPINLKGAETVASYLVERLLP